MNQEAKVAAKWWADTLRRPVKMDCGSELDARIINTVLEISQCREYLSGNVEDPNAFEDRLSILIQERIIEGDNWDEQRPMFGSAIRTIAVDYHPCKILLDAYGKDTTVFPIKTVMWVDPGKVSVGCGHGHPIEVLWESNEEK